MRSQISGLQLKDHIRESYIFSSRIIIASIIIVTLSLVIIARLAYLQILHQEHYHALSENNRVALRPIAPTRGLIYDRNGILLAQNLPSFSLELIPEHIDDLAATLGELHKLVQLKDEDIARFNKNRRRKRRFEGIPLRFRLSDEEVARVSSNLYRLPGVEIRAALARHYPLGKLASHAVGYVGRINEAELRKVNVSNYSATSHIGKVGVERAYEKLLHGTVGFQQVETNAQGRILKILERTLPIPGKNLFLNLDAKVQAVAEKAFGDNSGALVALDPQNGAVLALVSMPTYDPNLFVNGLDNASFAKLSRSPARPLFNRAIRGQYPPGSTLKPFMGLAGLELEEIHTGDQIKCPGYFTLKNDPHRYRDWKKAGHGETNLMKAIVQSCDVYFYNLSLNLGIDRMHQYLSGFGLGQRTGIDIHGELGGLLPSSAWKRRTYHTVWYPGETLIAGIGQGFMLTTPLQLSSITATLSLYGKRWKPNMIYAIQDADEKQHQLVQPVPLPDVVIARKQNWQTIITAMRKVVEDPHGTARRISHKLAYSVGAKTGTAQVFSIKQDEEYKEKEVQKKLRDHALFISFAPVERPRIAVAVVVENGGHGSTTAAPIARKVMDQYLLTPTPDTQQ